MADGRRTIVSLGLFRAGTAIHSRFSACIGLWALVVRTFQPGLIAFTSLAPRRARTVMETMALAAGMTLENENRNVPTGLES